MSLLTFRHTLDPRHYPRGQLIQLEQYGLLRQSSAVTVGDTHLFHHLGVLTERIHYFAGTGAD